MYFSSVQEFIDMGGHGLYVWLSYGIFALILVWNLWLVRSTRSASLKLATQSWRREDIQEINSSRDSKESAAETNA